MRAARLALRPFAFAVALTLATGLFAPRGEARPQDAPPRILLGFSPDGKDAREAKSLRLRPNVAQEVFVFAQNDGKADREVTVSLLDGDEEVAAQKFKADAGKTTRLKLKQPAPTAPAAPAAGAAAPPAAGAAAGPAMAPLKGAARLHFEVNGKAVGRDVEVEVVRPSDYVEVLEPEFVPEAAGGSRFAVRVRRRREFGGPPCKVDLVLRTDRIPELVEEQRRKGVYSNLLAGTGAEGAEVRLYADGLKLRGDGDRNRLVYLTVDGYERAFILETTFRRTGRPSAPTLVTDPCLRLTCRPFASPAVPYRVAVEVDNAPESGATPAVTKLDVASREAGKDGPFEEVARFRGDRSQRLLFGAGGPGGGFLFRPVLTDWVADYDMSGRFGPTTFRLQMFQGTEPVDVRDTARDPGPNDPVLVPKVTADVVFDDAPPRGLFVEVPKEVVRGAALAARAAAPADADVPVVRVVFYAGKPDPEGKWLSELARAEGVPVDRAKRIWGVNFRVSADHKGPVLLGADFINRAGVVARTGPVAVEVVDPAAAAAAVKTAVIRGTVAEGPRVQPGVDVQLLDTKNAVFGATKTDAEGRFAFKDVVPGVYRVAAAREASVTHGQTKEDFEVKAGEEKTLDEIKLFR
jgi:hypothetical protein